MICCPRFVFVHLPKTGGTWIGETLRHAPSSWQLTFCAAHQALLDVPKIYCNVSAFAFVRNPWDWYVSWYSFWNNYADSNRSARFNAEEQRRITIARQPFHQAVKSIAAEGFSLAQHHDRIVGARSVSMGRFENLRHELIRLLDEHGCKPGSDLRDRILSSRPIRVSRHRHWRDYYTRATAELVALQESRIIERYGYTFDSSA